MRRTLISALLVLLAALCVVGLTLSKSTRTRADLRFVNGSEPKTLDPQQMTGEPEGRIAEAIFEGLTRRDARSLEPAPGVAASWSVTPDGKLYTFQLRPDARWTDGRPVTAHDFAYAWRRLQDPVVGAEYAYIMHMVRYAEALNTHQAQAEALGGPILKALDELASVHPSVVPKQALLDFDKKQGLQGALKGTPSTELRAFLLREPGDLKTSELKRLRPELSREAERRRALHEEASRHFGVDGGVYARDAHTLVVELVAPTPYFLELLAFYPFFPIPRWVVEKSPRDWFLPGKLVGNGPFRLASWRVGDRIRLEKSPTYWGRDEVKLQSVDALTMENVTTSLNLYLTKEVDWLPHNNYPLDLAPDLRGREDFYIGPALITYFYRINCTRKPFTDPRVRKAINLAIDREQITRDVLGIGQTPAAHIVPPGIHGYQRPASGISYDVATARRLLAEAGFPDGKGFPKFGILYNTQESHKKIAEVIADQLRRNLQINANAYNQEWQSYQESTRNLDYDLVRYGWIGDYEDPNTFLDIWITNGGNNQTGWSNLLYDRLIEAAGNVETFLTAPEFLLERAHEPARLKALAEAVRQASDATARLKAMAELRFQLLAEAEGILVRDEFPIVPLYFYVNSGITRTNIGGFYKTLIGSDGKPRPNLRDLHPLREMYIKPEAPRRD